MLFTPRVAGHRDPIGAILGYGQAKVLAPGVIQPGFPFNGNLDLQACGYKIKTADPFERTHGLEHGSPEWEAAFAEAVAELQDDTRPSDYGVCDNWQQVLDRWPSLATDPRQLVIAATPVRRADEPAQGGWRWHKWGEYIGSHEPQHEYLHDEAGIDEVWCFHIYEVLSGPGL